MFLRVMCPWTHYSPYLLRFRLDQQINSILLQPTGALETVPGLVLTKGFVGIIKAMVASGKTDKKERIL
ncbi:hypothetical protein AML91_20565 [Paenibacillus jilunlii]|uniref:Uncharacterized protein n=1 Tax=Paenibacillus jilunlii TaxID=682956 RepID=A0ABR5SRY0_9BACL|nr:hypothetical protein AML91_20565 [Paenibacillus jilunlii]